MSNSMTWDGVDLSTYGFQVEAPAVPVMPSIPFKRHSAVFGDSEFTNTPHTTRKITLSCSVVGYNQENLRDRMEYITRVMNPVLTDKVFTLDYDPQRRYVGRVSAMTAPSAIGFWGFVFSITLECLAYKQGLAETNTAIAIATNPDTLSVGEIDGSANRIPAEFYVRNTTGATLTSTAITIANDTTSESIVVTLTLEDDRWLRVGTLDANGRFSSTIGKSTSTGGDPEAEAYTDFESSYTSGDWPRLQGGVVNSITVTGVATGTLEIVYRPRYIH
jgi:predicted phage tail component-like protein